MLSEKLWGFLDKANKILSTFAWLLLIIIILSMIFKESAIILLRRNVEGYYFINQKFIFIDTSDNPELEALAGTFNHEGAHYIFRNLFNESQRNRLCERPSLKTPLYGYSESEYCTENFAVTCENVSPIGCFRYWTQVWGEINNETQ